MKKVKKICYYLSMVFKNEHIKQQVKEKFNIELTPEIIYIGKMTKDEEEKWKIILKK